MKKYKKLLKIGEWGLFGIVLIIFMVTVSPLLPTKKIFSSYSVVSGSMEPNIHKGSIAFVKPVQSDSLKEGKVIAFTHPNNSKITVLHRIQHIGKEDNIKTFQTKGDANNSVDNWNINSNQIIGKYIFSIPYIGYITNYVHEPLGFFILIGIPALILLLLQIKSIKAGIEEEVNKRVRAQKINNSSIPKLFILILLFSCTTVQPIHSLLISTATLTGLTIGSKETFADVNMKLLSSNKKLKLTMDSIEGYKKVSYEITYDTDTVEQGIIGDFTVEGNNPFSKTFTLGTCSGSVCTYHQNPDNFNATITLEKPNGEKITITKTL